MLPGIGSVQVSAGTGRVGWVVDARPVGEPANGEQLVALRIKTTHRTSSFEESDPGAAAGLITYGPRGTLTISSVTGATGKQDRPSRPPGVAYLLSELSAQEKSELAQLQQRDQQVRQEEKAHAAIAGDLGGPINYIYQIGPDGRLYAVGGSVGISGLARSGDPAEAREIAARLGAAALAPTNPSAQDYAAARAAYDFAGQARRQREITGA